MPTDIPERRETRTGEPAMAAPAPAGRTGTAGAPGRTAGSVGGGARAAGIIAATAVCQAGLMVGLGLLVTGPAARVWPVSSEDAVIDALVRVRTGTLDTLSFVVSEAGNTGTVVIGTLISCLVLLLVPRLPRWRDAIFLAVAVSLQSLVFLVITEGVDRNRPDVDRLDASPPTSSYTSGHTGAATALYAGLAVLVLHRAKGPWRRALAIPLLLLPLLVAVGRMYRGMHHPTDVAGGLLNGGLSLLIVGRALLTGPHVPAPLPSGATALPGAAGAVPTGPASGRTAVVLNPTVTDGPAREAVRRVLERHGHHGAEFVETTADDPGEGQTRGAVRDGATLVVVCGGDGTVRAAAEALAGTGIPLAVVPCGTGNLLARNLGLPVEPEKALAAALRGTPHPIDLGRIEGDGLPPAHFTVMSGAGLDAAMLESTSDRAKARWGWPAYVVAGLRELRAPRMRLTVGLDGAPPLRRDARMVLIANAGTVQGGAALVPAARPDDGLLDLMILDPRGPGGWLSAVGSLLRPRPAGGPAPGADGGAHRSVEYFTFRHADLRFDAPQPRELDGDPVAAGRRLTAEVRPGALTVLVPGRGE
ncbi:diacylglycerol kinase family protein [Streptomyces salyersiae]|uniref:Diacylglycerol kinase family protein n=1 Tax=Streptomyces salyersiae TaxID=3075530 RepID=A0ABU2RXA1_9ACTN|nr:diacylglycerol kinase family protein [Streptomyces sp. DSM 41770]MDT0432208.1 diacylglycerol kinase family protein [Streptomyces sp. DSM 41770]